MGELHHLKATVAGAGVFGLAIALTLARRGAQVVLADPNPENNASAVAAGMLAPALESALDPLMAGRFGLLRKARDLWPHMIGDLPGVTLQRDGAVFCAEIEVMNDIRDRLLEQGAVAECGGESLFTPEDWRIDARPALSAMRNRLLALGGQVFEGPVQVAPAADAVILACGYQGLDLAPELSVLSPVRGQLLRFEGVRTCGPIERCPDGYLAPGQGGCVFGATMEPGRTDLEPDREVSRRLLDAAVALAPDIGGADWHAEVGIRAATPDGLPLVGSSARPGYWIAAGARRNGWLLAPLVAQLIADGLAGAPQTEAAALMSSGRFRQPDGRGTNPPG